VTASCTPGAGLAMGAPRRLATAARLGALGLVALGGCAYYEVPRFEDSLKVLGYDDRMVVRDVMELVAEALDG